MKFNLAYPARSLGSRLSLWLALLSFVVIGLLCIGVYLSVDASLYLRQEARLEKLVNDIDHLVREKDHRLNRAELGHALDDLLKDDRMVQVRILDHMGEIEYATAGGAWPRNGRQERMDFAVGELKGNYATVLLALNTEADESLRKNMAAILFSAALAGSAAIAFGGFLIVGFGLAPVRRLVEQTRGLSAFKLDRRLDATNLPEELSVLVDQFNALLGRLELAYQQLEGFNADVAHELRTPLATLIASSELALSGKRSCPELEDYLASGLEELRCLSAMVNDMLFLSQADRGARARRTPVASLAGLVGEVLDYHEAALQEAGLCCEIRGDADGEFDAALLRRALSNLLGNATRYAVRGSMLVVSIQRDDESWVRIGVADRGQEIPPESLMRIFDRFYRTDCSRQPGDKNHGLGLAIVAAIARMHDGSTFARSAAGITEIGLRLSVLQRD